MKDKISVEDKVLAILKSAEWVGSDQIEALFPKGEPGHFSWPQRLRGLRDQGFVITRRIRQGTKNLSEWHLGEAEETPDLATKAETPVLAQNATSLVDIAKKASNTLNLPENANLPDCPIFEKLGQKMWF